MIKIPHALGRNVTLALACAMSASALHAAAPAAKPVAPSAVAVPMPLKPVVSPSQRLCSAKTTSGLGTLALKPAEGAKPAKADYVLVNYIGYLAENGEVFDQGMQAAFPVEGVIPGFSEGLQVMAKGAVMRLCVPSALGYGATGAGTIGANADLVFQVELLDFKTAAEVKAIQDAQAASQSAQPAPTAPQQ
ncbi:MAG: FKBP-type peptidyl-prolyl cis-trans isomerase [Novosphingobium sp.]